MTLIETDYINIISIHNLYKTTTKVILTLFISVIMISMVFQPVVSQDLPERPVGHVNDFANILSSSERNTLETKLRTYRDSTSNVIAIATISSLQGYPREEIATKLFNSWRMWEGHRQNGVLFLIAPNEREMQIEVGYGLEGAVPDAIAGRIVRDILRPNFQNGHFYTGLDEATTAVIRAAAGEFDAISQNSTGKSPVAGFFLLLLVVIVIFSLLSKGSRHGGRRSRHTLGSGGVIIWGSGGFGGGRSGGFSSGGGGFGGLSGGGGFGSGGAGAGGSW